jgi:hypothetical protein
LKMSMAAGESLSAMRTRGMDGYPFDSEYVSAAVGPSAETAMGTPDVRTRRDR